MNKTIDLKCSVYEICKKDPEVIGIMKKIGFDTITEPGMLNTAGRFMTIAKGAKAKGMDIERVIDEFIKNGYQILK